MNDLTIILLMSTVCTGARLAMEPGMILSWMREPLVAILKAIETEREQSLMDNDMHKAKEKNKLRNKYYGKDTCKELNDEDRVKYDQELAYINERFKLNKDFLNGEFDRTKAKFNVFKPFSLCVWCMSSVWGTATFLTLHQLHGGITIETIPMLIISIFSCTALNATIDAILRKLNVY